MNIIVASNHLFCRELSSYLLDQAGYTVYEASDSTTLLDILCQIPIHLVLLDTDMPGLTCPEVVRSLEQQSQVSFVLLSKGSLNNSCSSPPPETATSRIASCFKTQNSLNWPYVTEDMLAQVRAALLPASSAVAAVAS
jgi:CheY-like chemotaxis protein